jgi:CRP-like cAMP-binding protein
MQYEEILAVLLAKTEIAKGLAVAELARLLAHAQVVQIEPGQVVIAEGQASDTLYIVIQGRLNVVLPTVGDAHPNRFNGIHLNTLQPGDCCGEYSLIDGQPASASVITLAPTVLLKMTRTAFQSVAETHNKLARVIYCNLLHILIHRLRNKDLELDLNFDV